MIKKNKQKFEEIKTSEIEKIVSNISKLEKNFKDIKSQIEHYLM